jgi:hypothetical protein
MKYPENWCAKGYLNVVAIKKPPSDMAKWFRDMADKIDSGIVNDAVVAYTQQGEYEFMFGASKLDAVSLSTLLQTTAVDRMRIE